jgi:hypothetical protein
MIPTIRFAYNNLWRKGTIYNKSDQHPQFPWEDTQLDTPSQFGRSRYGAGSGNGNFITSAGAYAGPDLVVNGGFSVNTDGWTSEFGSLASVAGGQSGNCLQITRVSGTYQNAKQQIFGLTIGSIYFLTGHVKSGTSGNEAGFIQFDMGGGNYFRRTFTSSGTWTMYTLMFKASATSGILELNKFTATAGTMLFDSVVMALYAGTNIFINFDEGGAELEGIVAVGTYNGNTLATAIAAAMNAAPGKALVYVSTYNETTAKFTISAGGNFTIRWKTGTMSGGDISDICGYSDAANDTGASSYVGDYRRIHWPFTYFDCDLLALADINFFGIINHNISSAGIISLTMSTAPDFSSGNSYDTLSYNAYAIFKFLSTINKRYIRLTIQDPTNPNPYIQVGPIWTAKYFEPSRSFSTDGYEDGGDDPSDIEFSPAGVLYAQERPFVDGVNLTFNRIDATSKAQIRALIEEVGLTRSLIAVFDSSQPNTTSMLARLDSIAYPAYAGRDLWNWSCSLKEII